MNATAGTVIHLDSPRVEGQRVSFSWRESPPSGLYRKTEFFLELPDSVPLAGVPERLWWTLFLLCVHVHWSLIRPCRVILPVRLDARELALWEALLARYADTLDAVNPGRPLAGRVEIGTGDQPLEDAPAIPDQGRCAAAYSGGKDSLAQAGLLCEMGCRPLLVTTTSPMDGTTLHQSSHRRRAIDEIQARRGLELVEVVSDLRNSWDNLAARRWGYPLSLNELGDTFLYTAALALVAYVRGVTRIFLASENEVSVNSVVDGVYLQHTHFMYSGLTQAGLRAILEPYGLGFGSLTASLHSSQVQELVTRRYPDLRDLQCSCWRTTETRRACSECSECKRLAWVSLACGGEPADQGVDLVWMLNHYGDYTPRSSRERPHPPNRLASQRFRAQIIGAIRRVTPGRLLGYLARRHPRSLVDGSGWSALRRFLAIRADALGAEDPGPDVSGYRAGYLQLLPTGARPRLEAILADQFPAEAEDHYAEQLANLLGAIRAMDARATPDAPPNA